MLLSIQAASKILGQLYFVVPAMSAGAAAMFLFPLFQKVIDTQNILTLILFFGVVGSIVGAFVTYRSSFNSSYALGAFLYWMIFFEVLFFGGPVAIAAEIGGRPDLKWVMFFSYVLTIVVTLLGGMYNEAKALKLKRTDHIDDWKEKLEKHVDFNNRLVKPSLTVDPRSLVDGKSASSLIWIGAAASVNIPLLFEVYGGGKYNAIFLVVPLMIALFSYLHITLIGPALVRLLLLRKLEKSLGYRFVNADYEQIQELRRTFFLSRWLMKDYVKPADKAATNGAVQRK